jgi:hypothetical protein
MEVLTSVLRPELRLLRVYTTATDLTQQDRGTIDHAVGKTVYQHAQLSLSHALIVAAGA